VLELGERKNGEKKNKKEKKEEEKKKKRRKNKLYMRGILKFLRVW
jgi:hypothetical protein